MGERRDAAFGLRIVTSASPVAGLVVVQRFRDVLLALSRNSRDSLAACKVIPDMNRTCR